MTGGTLRSWAVRLHGDRGPTRDSPRPGPVGLTEPWSIPTASGYPHRALAAPGGGPVAWGTPRPSWPESRGTAAGLSRTIRRHQRERDRSGGEALRRVVTDTALKGQRTVGWGIWETRTSLWLTPAVVREGAEGPLVLARGPSRALRLRAATKKAGACCLASRGSGSTCPVGVRESRGRGSGPAVAGLRLSECQLVGPELRRGRCAA